MTKPDYSFVQNEFAEIYAAKFICLCNRAANNPKGYFYFSQTKYLMLLVFFLLRLISDSALDMVPF